MNWNWIIDDEHDNYDAATDPKWHEKERNEIATLESDYEIGITKLCARKLEAGWEYAVVHWYHYNCTVVSRFMNGVVTEGAGKYD